MLVQFWMLFEVGLQLRDFSVDLLACLNRAFKFSPIDLSGVIILFLDFEDVHKNHALLFLFHILCVKSNLLKDLLNFSVSVNCCCVGIVKLIISSISCPSSLSMPSILSFSSILTSLASTLIS